MTIDELRELIARLEPLMDHFVGSFEELEVHGEGLGRAAGSTFVSDIADPEALLLAALVWRLKDQLRRGEQGLRALAVAGRFRA